MGAGGELKFIVFYRFCFCGCLFLRVPPFVWLEKETKRTTTIRLLVGVP